MSLIENHFKAYNEVESNIRYKTMELMKLKEDFYNITGVNLDTIKVKGGTSIDMADKLHVIVEKEKSLVALENYHRELRRVHEIEINKITNVNKRTVLKLFYLDHCSIKQIAYCLGVSDGHVKKLKRWALYEFIDVVNGAE